MVERLGDALARLRDELRRLERVVVAFSGGADSAFVAWVATDTLGSDRVLCATAVSPSLAPEELADCRALAAEWGLRHVEVETVELADPAYVANDGSRCYHCKTSLLDALGPLAAAEGSHVVLGVNVDDLGDHRPGQQAATERGALFPLVTAGMTKAEVRALVERARPAHLGQARRRLSVLPGPLWDSGHLRRPAVGGRCRVGPAGARVPPAAGAPLRRHGQDRGPRVTTWLQSWPSGRRSRLRSTPPATGMSRLTSTDFVRATSTTRWGSSVGPPSRERRRA